MQGVTNYIFHSFSLVYLKMLLTFLLFLWLVEKWTLSRLLSPLLVQCCYCLGSTWSVPHGSFSALSSLSSPPLKDTQRSGGVVMWGLLERLGNVNIKSNHFQTLMPPFWPWKAVSNPLAYLAECEDYMGAVFETNLFWFVCLFVKFRDTIFPFYHVWSKKTWSRDF